MDTTNVQALLESEVVVDKKMLSRILHCSPRTVERNWQKWGLSELHLSDGSVRFLTKDVKRFIYGEAGSEQAQASGQS